VDGQDRRIEKCGRLDVGQGQNLRPNAGDTHAALSTRRSGFDMKRIGNWLIWIAALLTLWSMGYYLRMAWPEIAKRSAEK
jgi:phosphatidylglycerophosphate synthase